MFKRTDKDDNSHSMVPSKRFKSDGSKKSSLLFGTKSKNDSSNKQNVRVEDVWGDDFAEEEIEEMDFVASQACLNDDKVFIDPKEKQISFIARENMPSTSKQIFCPTKTQNPTLHDLTFTQNNDYSNFEKRLLYKQNYNSTFQVNKNISPQSNDSKDKNLEKELNKLKTERDKLLNDFIMKDGETVFLRNQLQMTQMRIENDKIEKMHLIEEQSKKHKTEIDQIIKEKEDLKTQLELKAFEIEKLLERCKLLESRNIKFIEPHTTSIMSPDVDHKIDTMSRSIFSTKYTDKKDVNVQINICDRKSNNLKTSVVHYPLLKIPAEIFKPSLPEKSVVEIKVTEKTGKQNLPILQDERTFRIFENPDLVKPIITMINGKKLSLEFVLPDIALIKNKVSTELNSDTCIPIINKLVSTSRELIINMIVVLQTILEAMKNDDIRDMNDVYFSDLYKMPIYYTKSVCDANTWHENERGIEARRILGILSYIASESLYLSKYVAGKTSLFVDKDESYKEYSQYMIRYNSWDKKDKKFEMLEMILQLVILIGQVRRSHQFSGLISAIADLLCNVEKTIGYCEKGIDFIFEIFKELVFSRPLSLCYIPITKVMMTFIKHSTFANKICKDTHTSVKIWKGVPHFTPDACLLRIFIIQVENFHFDLVTTIKMTHSLLLFIKVALHMNVLLIKNGNPKSCDCCMKLLRFVIKMLCRCSTMSLNNVQFQYKQCTFNDDFFVLNTSNDFMEKFNKQYIHSTQLKKYGIKEYMKQMNPNDLLDQNYWTNINKKQLNTMREGITFLRYLATRDPDFIIRISDIEDSFHLFMHNINKFDNLILHENDQEALNFIKSTFVFDKALLHESQKSKNKIDLNRLGITKDFRKKSSDFSFQNIRKDNSQEDYRNIFAAYKNLFNS
ncbi:hypothetical protein M0804_006351 [Polistes exclamans]|nr:hypothetical protein M0804_006351 [Polistes exclamans]